MPKLLPISSSPRGERPASSGAAHAYIETLRERRPDLAMDTLDVWKEELPAFDHHALHAKYAGLAGMPLTEEQQMAWSQIEAIAKRFFAAELLPEVEFDHQKSYMHMWLRFVGVSDIETLTVERILPGPAVAQEARRQGIAEARTLAQAHY